MQQIISFIFKNSLGLLFLLLLGTSIGFTVQSHSYHKSKVISSANFVSGFYYGKVNSVNEYFNLKVQNDELALENARLKMLLFNKKDTLVGTKIDTLVSEYKTKITIGKVTNNSYSSQNNFLTINIGAAKGIKSGMAVINSLGIVGTIENVSTNYSTVFSILNVQSKIDAKPKNSNHFGTLIWTGKNAGFAQLTEIPRLASVKIGDTIVTGTKGTSFPSNINIGTVEKMYTDNESNNYTLDIRLFNDMTSLGYIYVITSRDKKEIIQLEKKPSQNE